jgi:branched-chain amino acid transport system substrate-binding protein
MKQAASLKNLELGLLIPGIKISTGPTDFYPIEQMQMAEFKGDSFHLFGPVFAGEIGSGS